MSWSATVFATAIEALSKRPDGRGSSIGTVTRSILRYPIKTLAAFAMAPLLTFRVACVAKDPVRRVIAGAGLIAAVVVAWLVAFGGVFAFFRWVGFFGIWQEFGLGAAIGWALFAYISTTVSVISAVLALNATAWLFLHMSSEEVVEYLRTLSE